VAQQRKGVDSEGRESERRRAILRAAIDVFARKGYHGCRIADVAREAGVAYGLVYHYFRNKDELLQMVFEAGWTGFITRLNAVAAGEGSFAEKVRGMVEVAFEAYRHDPRAVRVLILEIARSPAGARINRQSALMDVIRMCADLFHHAQQAGEMRRDVEPVLAATFLFGAVEMGLTAFVAGLMDAREAGALDRAKAQLAESFLRGVLPDGALESAWKGERPASRIKANRRT
jgi:TetR/AcrR family transcriptional regulator, fatty acid metabolism regulator protein